MPGGLGVEKPGGGRTVKKTTVYPWAVLLALVSISPALAGVVELGASKDNTLYQDLVGDLSNGAGIHLFTGTTLVGELRRGVIAFDVAAAVPRGVTIDSVTLTLHMSKTNPFAGPQEVFLHRILAD